MKLDPVIKIILVFAVSGAAWFIVPRESLYEKLALFYQSDYVSIPEGTLIKAEGDERVYYAENGHKRWIDSAQTFMVQGFRLENIHTLTSKELDQYSDGEPITALTRLILPREQKVLPDLAPLAPYDLRLSTVGGRTVIRFTGSFWNKGYRPFEILTENHMGNSTEDVYQHIQDEDGTYRKKFVGTFVWHPAHNHHHYGDFAEYLFEPAQLVPGTKISPLARQKTTFCIRDDERMPADIPNTPERQVFTICGKEKQGISAGWIDVYKSTLPDQYIDVHDLPPGVYALSFLLDPLGHFIEERSDNNIATTLVELNAQLKTLRIIASMSPFLTLQNRAENGTLLRNAKSGDVYIMQYGRKRWLRSADIFTSYGYNWNSVYPVTRSMIDGIPNQQLIRRQNTSEVFVVNEQGYYRHIMNPEVFASYGFTPEDISNINELDFASYTRSELIMHTGDTQIYVISETTKHPIGTLSSLQSSGRDLRKLHLVNQTDFNSYTTN